MKYIRADVVQFIEGHPLEIDGIPTARCLSYQVFVHAWTPKEKVVLMNILQENGEVEHICVSAKRVIIDDS